MEGYFSHLLLLYLYHFSCFICVISLVGTSSKIIRYYRYGWFFSTCLAMMVSIMIIFSYDGANSDYVSIIYFHLDFLKSNSIKKFKETH
jgi:hypothetical protein